MATAVTYARRSKVEARKEVVESVEAQQAENLEWAAGHHVAVIGSFQDNMTASRFSDKDRPEFLKMMEVIRDQRPDMVIVTEQSRLDRQLWTILELIELARTRPFKIVKVRDDDVINLSTEAGINRTIDQANRDRHESELISQRLKAHKRNFAKKGRFDGGPRPFGYEKDGVTVRESEAEIIRECAERVLDGASFASLTRELNERRVPTSSGKRWQRSTLQVIFRSKRIIGVREHDGAEYPAKWDPIISRDQWEQIQLILDARAIRKTRTGRSYLLTGFVWCGGCGGPMSGAGHHVDGALHRRYYCVPEDSSGLPRGCGKVSRAAEPLEALVSNAVLYRLDSDGLAQAFGQATEDGKIQEALAEYQETKALLGNLITDYYTERNKYAKEEMQKLKAELQARIDQITRKMERLDSTRILASVPFGQTVRQIWDEADLELKRNLVRLLVAKIVIKPGRPGGKRWTDENTGRSWQFDPSNLEIKWKS